MPDAPYSAGLPIVDAISRDPTPFDILQHPRAHLLPPELVDVIEDPRATEVAGRMVQGLDSAIRHAELTGNVEQLQQRARVLGEWGLTTAAEVEMKRAREVGDKLKAEDQAAKEE